MVSLRNAILVVVLVLLSAGSAVAFDVQIDAFDFATAVNTKTINVTIVDPPASGLDVGLPTVLGGSRQVDVTNNGAFFVEAGVVVENHFDFMSSGGGGGEATIGYSGNGAGLGAALATCEGIRISYVNADAEAVAGTPVIVALNDGVVTEMASSAVPAIGDGVLEFPMTSFPTVNRSQLARIGVTIDGSPAADLGLDTIVAVGCMAPESPAPAMGAGPLALATMILAGLGFLGFRRRFS